MRRVEVEQFGVVPGVGYISEVPLRLVDLVGIAQRLEHQPTPARLEADDIFAAPERKLAEPDLSGPLERLAQHDERFLGEIVRGHNEIGLFVIEKIGRASCRERVCQYV